MYEKEGRRTFSSDRSLMEAIGKGVKVTRYEKTRWDSDDESVFLYLSDGRKLELYLDADCCSVSYFTDVTQFAELVGHTLLEAEERTAKGFEDKSQTDYREEFVRPHFLVFKTDAGHVTIDWRNASNGYYDGELLWEISPA